MFEFFNDGSYLDLDVFDEAVSFTFDLPDPLPDSLDPVDYFDPDFFDEV